MRRLIAVLLLSIFVLISCGKNAEKGPGKLPVGYLDTPKPGETIRGIYRIAGWALSESGIRDVSIFVDRNFVGMATLGQSRPDLPAHFSMFPNPEYGGFEYQWDTTSVSPGPHELTAQARTNNGATRDLGTVGVTTAR